jgi:hypothetical protein
MRLRSALRLPKEHGAWAMLYVPFIVGTLVAGEISIGVWMLALSVSCVFIARESLLAWWRARDRKQDQREPLKYLLTYLGLASLFGAPLVFIHHLFWLLLFGLAALILLSLNARQAMHREDRRISGEMIAIAGLTLTGPASYYVSRGAFDIIALWIWALSAAYFTSSVFYVKLRVYSLNQRKEQLRRQTWWRCALYHGFLAGSLILLALTGSLNLFILAAFSPVLIRSFWQLARPANRINLRRVGVLEIIYSLVFLVFITLTFRLV